MTPNLALPRHRALDEWRATSRRGISVGLAMLTLATLTVGCGGRSAEAPRPVAPTEPAPPSTGAPETAAPKDAPRPPVAELPPPEVSKDTLAAHRVDQWYGVYMMGKKIGHARVEMRPSAEGEPGFYAAHTQLEMTVRGLTGENTMRMSEARFYGDAAPHWLIESRMRSETSGMVDERVAKASFAEGQPSGLTVSRRLGGQQQPERSLAPTRESLASLVLTMPTDAASLKPGQTASAPVFNWEAEKDDLVQMTVTSVRPGIHAGVETTLATLEMKYQQMGLTATTLIAGDGVTVEMTLGPGLVMKLEEREVAMSDVVGLDVMGSGVPVATRLGHPHDITELTLRVKTPEGRTLPSLPNQRVTPLEGGWSRVVLRAAPGATVTAEERTAALQSDPTMNSDAPSVAAKAAELTAGAADDAEKVRRLGRWVFETLDKELATHLPSASTILERKVGDCTEHTWLFVALARAAGVPARPVYGVAYVGDRFASFGYHAWAEVALDGHWVMVDPTWGEAVADATHLRLSRELHDVAGLLGGLELEVEGEPKRR